MAMIELVNKREQQLVSMRKLIALCILTDAFPIPTVLGRLILGKCIWRPALKPLKKPTLYVNLKTSSCGNGLQFRGQKSSLLALSRWGGQRLGWLGSFVLDERSL